MFGLRIAASTVGPWINELVAISLLVKRKCQ